MHNPRWKFILIGLMAFLWNVASMGGLRPIHGADPWIGYSHDAGRGVGYENSYSTFQGFLPVPLDEGRSLLFADLNYRLNNVGDTGGNVGIGFRQYNDVLNRTFGGYVYFDQSQTPANEFSQLSVGLETLGEHIDFRTNVYLPQMFNSAPKRSNKPVRFRNDFLFIPTETAMSGLDMEIGGPLPLIPTSAELKAFGGWYFFDSKRRKKLYGWKARIEARITKSMAMDFSVQHDKEFETTVNLGVLIQFPFKKEHGYRKVEERLADPVEKLRNVVLVQQEEEARDSVTGEPILFIHVAPGGNSDGSFEDPYGTLAQAFADPRSGQGNVVIYDRTANTHTGNITLADRTQLLSSQPVQFLETQFDAIRIPLSGQGGTLPTIIGDVTLSNVSKISGFDVQGQVIANNINAFVVSDNIISNPAGDGVAVENGFGFIESNNFSGSAGSGLSIQGMSFTGDVLANTFDNNGGDGIDISVASFDGDVSFNSSDNNTLAGIRISSTTFDGDILSNTASGNLGGEGFKISGSTLTGDIARNTANANSTAGFDINVTNITGDFIVNSADGNLGGDGIAIAGTTFTGNFNRNVANNNATAGFDLNINTITGDFINNRADDNLGGEGFAITSGTFSGRIGGNGAEANATHGFNLNLTTFNGDFLLNAATGNLGGAGVMFVGTNLNGNVINNFSTLNATKGMDFAVDTYIGNFSNNFVEDNLGGEGVLLVGTTFNGNVEDNITDTNATKGFSMTFTNITSDFLRNTSDGNLGGEGFDLNATTFIGVIEANTANSNIGGAGLSINTTDYTGEIRDNTVTLNSGGGYLVNVANALTGNIIRNIADRNILFGFDIDALTYTGDLESNIATNTAASNITNGFGFDIATNTFEGDVFLNTALVNANVGLQHVVDDFTGDFTFNIANDNVVAGIRLANTNLFTGDITNNRTDDNRADAANNFGDGFNYSTTDAVGIFSDNSSEFNDRDGYNITIDTIVGNIERNVGNSNGRNGFLMSIDTVDVSVDLAGTSISDNIANENSFDGMNLTFSKTFTGIIENNQANDNNDDGIEITVDNFTGDIIGNTTNRNRGGRLIPGDPNLDGGMILNVTDTYDGLISDNTANENGVFGYFFRIDTIMDASDDTADQIEKTGEFSRNIAILNDDEGFVLQITGDKDSGLRVIDNVFQSNDFTFLPNIFRQRDMLATYSGVGTLVMILDQNISIPFGTQFNGFITDAAILNDPSIQLNYDIQNLSTGRFLLRLGTNIGNIGNSAGTSPVIQFLP